ncbi:MAG: hypothetical protein U0T81_00825 [Saprospiraceae bacterium]
MSWVWLIIYTVGDANCHVELTRAVTVQLDPPVTPWFISSISKCLCPSAEVDLETFLKSSDSIPRGGILSIVTNLTPAATLQCGVGSHDLIYNGGCGALVVRYTLTRCNGTTVFQDYTLNIRECAKLSINYIDDLVRRAYFFPSYVASGCSDYIVLQQYF